MKKEIQKPSVSAAKPSQPVEKRHSPQQESRKTFQQGGHWIQKPVKTAILVCVCGNRYLKTRPAQVMCLICMRRG